MFYSCQHIRDGFNFYRSGKITSCCMKISPELEIARIGESDIVSKILYNQAGLISRHKSGNPPEVCKNCSSFIEKDWDTHLMNKFTTLTLNHYKKCNLKCIHCGYRAFDDREEDTPHDAVLDTILKCVDGNICHSKLHLEVGGGEPSLATGLATLLQYALSNSWTTVINSNGALFSDIFAAGVNAQQFQLVLTPDAGSRETYARIKGVDNFDNTWRNIGRYMLRTHGQALVKFILESGNKNDIPAMINTARKYGTKTLVLSLDMNIKKHELEEYLIKAKQFIYLAKKNGMSVLRGAFLPPL